MGHGPKPAGVQTLMQVCHTVTVGYINPSSSTGLHKLLQVSLYHFEQYQQFTSGIMISHACEDDMMFTCTLSVYRRPEIDTGQEHLIRIWLIQSST